MHYLIVSELEVNFVLSAAIPLYHVHVLAQTEAEAEAEICSKH